MKLRTIRRATAVAAALAATCSHATTINIIDVGGVSGSQAELGFKIAAAYWSKMLTNNATINIEIAFNALPQNVIGSTGSRRVDYSVANWENRVAATRSSSTIDQSALLPTLSNGGVTGALTNGVDGNGNNNVNVSRPLQSTETAAKTLYTNSAVVKAVGGSVSSPGSADARITFSSAFSFDFNPTDGISAGQMDFLGVAIHEMGHALGFVSGVDFFDVYGCPAGPECGLGYDLNSTSLFSALDMFRYGAPGQLDFRANKAAYFSIDGGVTALMGNQFATGAYNGDGRQASHWKDAQGCSGQLGIMDPTFCSAQMGEITGLDLAAFDAMGWNLSTNALTYGSRTSAQIYAEAVPEPGTWALMFSALGLMAAGRRGRRQRTN